MECTHCQGSGKDEWGECWECQGKAYTLPTTPRTNRKDLKYGSQVIAQREEKKDDTNTND